MSWKKIIRKRMLCDYKKAKIGTVDEYVFMLAYHAAHTLLNEVETDYMACYHYWKMGVTINSSNIQ